MFRLTLLLVFGMSVTVWSQKGTTFVELPDPTADTLSDWSGVSPGLHSSFVSIDKRFPRSKVPEIEIQQHAKVVGWKGERVSAQLLLWTTSDVASVQVELTHFQGKEGSLPQGVGEARFVRYVMTDEFASGCGHRKPENFAASLSADMLDDVEALSMSAKTVRPVWITVRIPSNALAGHYSAHVLVKVNGKEVHRHLLDLRVQQATLPPPSAWKFHLDQWQHPAAVARVNQVPVWSDAHFEALVPVMTLAAQAGQKVITTTLNKDPWNVQTFDPYADMIIWTKNSDGSWSYDYSIFDRWVKLMMDLGVRKMINCYSIIPWNNEVHYKSATTGEWVNVKAKPGTEAFEAVWEPFLKDFVRHLREKGWLEITHIAIDERTREEVDGALRLLQRVAPELGVSYADNQKTYQRYPNSEDISISVGHPFSKEDLNDRRLRGLNTTFYICCSDAFPNQFTFSDPAESAYLAWYAEAVGFDGLLRWAFNSWVENPLQDSRFRTWPAGDTYIVYPQGRSSIRYERMVEGIQDYEKIQILKAKLSAAEFSELQTAIGRLNKPIRTSEWNTHLNEAKALLAILSER